MCLQHRPSPEHIFSKLPCDHKIRTKSRALLNWHRISTNSALKLLQSVGHLMLLSISRGKFNISYHLGHYHYNKKCNTEFLYFWQITKQIILVIKHEGIVFVKTNYFKCLCFSRSEIKVYQIFQTYSGTITNRRRKCKTMVTYQIFLIFKMIIESKVVRSAYQCQKTSHLHL